MPWSPCTGTVGIRRSSLWCLLGHGSRWAEVAGTPLPQVVTRPDPYAKNGGEAILGRIRAYRSRTTVYVGTVRSPIRDSEWGGIAGICSLPALPQVSDPKIVPDRSYACRHNVPSSHVRQRRPLPSSRGRCFLGQKDVMGIVLWDVRELREPMKPLERQGYCRDPWDARLRLQQHQRKPPPARTARSR